MKLTSFLQYKDQMKFNIQVLDEIFKVRMGCKINVFNILKI